MNAHRRTWPRPLTETQASTLRALYGHILTLPEKTAAPIATGDAISTDPSPEYGGNSPKYN